MNNKIKGKTNQRVIVPQDLEQAEKWLSQIGIQRRIVARIEADVNDKIAKLKEKAEIDAAKYKSDIEGLIEGLQAWAVANRDQITDNGKRQSADLATGTITWRLLPAKVTLRKIESVIESCKKLGLQRFIRIKEELNKDAMREEREIANQIPGVTVASAGETFSVEPFEVELEATKV